MATDFRNTNYARGIRNNNPGNLRSGSNWQGMVGTDGNDFIIFSDMKYGTRALATDLSNKFFKGLNTVSKIISVYAPPSENNTIAYINAVSNAIGVNADTPLDWSKATLAKFVRAVITHENGNDGSVVTDQIINDGIATMTPSLLLKIQGF
jgi:hypothetical protein